MLTITKQMLRDKVFFSGATSALDLAHQCNVSQAQFKEFTALLDQLVKQGTIVENRGLYSASESFNLKGEVRK